MEGAVVGAVRPDHRRVRSARRVVVGGWGGRRRARAALREGGDGRSPARSAGRHPVVRVLLLTTYEVALRRVAGDPERDLSKDPDRLRAAYERAMPMLEALPAADWTFDTTDTSVERVVDDLVDGLLGTGVRPEHGDT